MNFREFTKSSLPNAWVKEPGVALYVRKSIRPYDFDLANLSANHPGHGAFTRFLDENEPHFTFFVENIMNQRLVGFLMKRGYNIVTNCPDSPSMAIDNVTSNN